MQPSSSNPRRSKEGSCCIAEQEAKDFGRFGGDEFTANFVTWIWCGFEEKDFQSAVRGCDGGGGTGGACANDSEIKGHFHTVTAIRYRYRLLISTVLASVFFSKSESSDGP